MRVNIEVAVCCGRILMSFINQAKLRVLFFYASTRIFSKHFSAALNASSVSVRTSVLFAGDRCMVQIQVSPKSGTCGTGTVVWICRLFGAVKQTSSVFQDLKFFNLFLVKLRI